MQMKMIEDVPCSCRFEKYFQLLTISNIQWNDIEAGQNLIFDRLFVLFLDEITCLDEPFKLQKHNNENV